MAASDQTYRNQKALHMVFAVSSVAMLVTTGWMFWDDYNRPFKKEQRTFRDVEEEMAKRALLATAPSAAQRDAVVQAEKTLARARAVHNVVRKKADDEVSGLQTDQFKAEKKLADVKADFDSLMSYFNIEVESHSPSTAQAQDYRVRMDAKQKEMNTLKLELEEIQGKIAAVNNDKKVEVTVDGETVAKTPQQAEADLSRAEDDHKKKTEEFDRFVKLAAQKQWTFLDTFRKLPIVDAFASPVRIQQYTLEELPIDYSFKYVTRYDRCTTCHLGMERANFDKASLQKLLESPATDAELQAHLEDAKKTIDERNRIIGEYNAKAQRKDRKDPLPVTASDLEPKPIDGLSASRITQYAAHPRLDLFVDSNSPHPVEKFGCSSCHGGQGSATTFLDATHTPNDTVTREHWQKDHNWASIHFWDFPMLPVRFREAGCLKCHHQVEGLIRDQTKVEAPTLVEGYSLVRELGCFGCHEIPGQKSGRWVGPDLRLESDPPLESLSPEERTRRLADTANPPGTMRKVGPNLARIAEKTYEDWVRQWIKSPRDFRPDTRMPHYYHQANNIPEVLDDTGKTTGVDQRQFPDAEVNSIAHYLMQKSRELLKDISDRGKEGPEARDADIRALADYSAQLADPKTTEEQKRTIQQQLARVKANLAARGQPRPVAEAAQLPPPPTDDKAKTDQLDRGRFLFSLKGCLACHQHNGTAQAKVDAQPPLPAITGDSYFGPNLSRLASKIGTQPGDPQSGRKWLVQWLLNPKIHSPRTKMPSVQLADNEADDIASWLLGQSSDWRPNLAINTDTLVKPDMATLKAMARVWLAKVETSRKLTQVIDEDKGYTEAELATKAADADERLLSAPLDEGKLKMYIGKKAINNLGCFGCHTIPGFENAKPIGTPLNEWGKKDPARIDYADAATFVHDKFNTVDARRDLTEKEKTAHNKPWEFEGDKPPYERYYAETLGHEHQTREGFLHLKLQEPRGYDYNRIKNWEDRLRMPQFKFARLKAMPKKDGESDDAYRRRIELEMSKAEAEARQAVMTFILGLVAEPVPAKYVYTPTGDRLAEIKGREVLDRFNCIGCHLVQSGTFEFKLTNSLFGEKEKDGKKVPVTVRDAVLGLLETRYNDVVKPDTADHRFPEHNAWAGPPQPKDRIIARGLVSPELIPDDTNPKKNDLLIRLTHALRFTTTGANGAPQDLDLPAFTDAIIPQDALASRREPLGGVFAESLAKFLEGVDAQKFGGEDKSHAAVPPTLIREGEKVQSGWLFQFLKNPHPIRPVTVLRMPNFGLSDDDALALVNYFAAVDRINNPGIGLTYPYFAIPQRDDGYLEKMSGEYVERLKRSNLYDARVREYEPVWTAVVRDQIADAESSVRAAEARLQEAKQKNQAVPEAEKAVTAAQGEVKKRQQKLETKDFKDLQRQWERREVYVTEAMRLVSNVELCLSCHDVGTMKTADAKGPPLSLSADRLRPDWTYRWLANPQRFLPHKSVMPTNFPANAETNPYANVFIGSEKGFTKEEIQAARDFLMIYPQVADWPVLKHRPGLGTNGGK